MRIPFSPLSTTRRLDRPRGYHYPMLLLVIMVVALMGWARVYYMSSELSDAQAGLADDQTKLDETNAKLYDVQAKLAALQNESTPAQSQTGPPAALPVYPQVATAWSDSSSTNAPGQPKPAHAPSTTNRPSSHTSPGSR